MSDADLPKKKLTALVLGGTAPHIALIQRLKARGYRAVLLDYLENPPARECADEHVRESTMDEEVVLSIARDRKADLVISACVDQANVTACAVGQQLGLPIPYSHSTALRVSNKVLMKEGMLKAGVETSRHIHARTVEDILGSGLRFPLVVKPADSCSSNAVKKIDEPAQVQGYFNDAVKASRTGTVVVEEFVEGREISVYAFVHQGKAEVLLMAERHSVIDGTERVLKCYCTTAPAELSLRAHEALKVNMQRIVREFELDNTPLHVQALVNGDSVNVIEFAPRVGGGLSYHTILGSTGFDIIDSSIDSFLGIQVQPVFSPPSCSYAINILYADPGALSEVRGMGRLIDEGVVEAYHPYKLPGATIGDGRASAARVGALIVRGDSFSLLVAKVVEIAGRIDVLDADGRSIFRRDLAKELATNIHA